VSRRPAAAGALALALSGAAHAQWSASDDAELCIAGTGRPDLDSRLCQRAASAPGIPALSRATLEVHRGRALTAGGDPLRAVAAFDAALALNPGSAAAYHGRGVARRHLGEPLRSIDDLDRAIALSPGFAAAHRERGVAQLVAGSPGPAAEDFSRALAAGGDHGETWALRGIARFLGDDYLAAAEDLRRAESLALPYDYLGLWIYLAEVRGGRPARPGLTARAAALAPEAWPAPLYAIYLGRVEPRTALASPPSDNPALARQRTARAQAFIGLLAVAERRTADAACAFQAALDPGAPGALEPAIARNLLAALPDQGCGPGAR